MRLRYRRSRAGSRFPHNRRPCDTRSPPAPAIQVAVDTQGERQHGPSGLDVTGEELRAAREPRQSHARAPTGTPGKLGKRQTTASASSDQRQRRPAGRASQRAGSERDRQPDIEGKAARHHDPQGGSFASRYHGSGKPVSVPFTTRKLPRLRTRTTSRRSSGGVPSGSARS